MQDCCALQVGTLFVKILQQIAVMAILSSITPLLNSQTSNKHFALTPEIFTNNILSAIDSLVQSFYGKKSVNLPLIATEGFSTVLDSAMYPY